MQTGIKGIRPGVVLIFPRAKNDKVALILSLIIKIFYPKWDMFGWHMAVATERDFERKDWMVLEATWPVVKLTPLKDMLGSGEPRCYQWLDSDPSMTSIETFVNAHLGKRYDILLYPWTFVQYMARHFWNRRVPRWLDDKFTCWELACEFCEAMGKPIVSKYDCPVLPDILKELEK